MLRAAVDQISTHLARARTGRAAVRQLGELVNRGYWRFSDPPVTPISNCDWDNLIILDACRYDLFVEEATDLPGTIGKTMTAASDSSEFLQKHFPREQFDTVAVTANPWAIKLCSDRFHALIDCLNRYWDEDLGTVPPEAIADTARETLDVYPNKRMLIHFMQPHYPFIGERGREIDDSEISPDGVGTAENISIWHRLKYGYSAPPVEDIWTAYRENLRLVLDVIQPLLHDLPGKTVITADHGNLVAERQRPIPVKGFGHPNGLYLPELVTVPWLEIDGDRREIIAEPPVTNESRDPDVSEKLEALGYLK